MGSCTHQGDEPLLCMSDEASSGSFQVVSSPSLGTSKQAMIIRLPRAKIQLCLNRCHNLWRLRHLSVPPFRPLGNGYVIMTPPSQCCCGA